MNEMAWFDAQPWWVQLAAFLAFAAILLWAYRGRRVRAGSGTWCRIGGRHD